VNDVIVETRNLTKVFVRDQFHVTALNNASIQIYKGDFVALMGPSGSGKSTLLHLIAALDRPSATAHWRNAHIGFIFQSFNLLPVLTALENVELPLKLTKLSRSERLAHATKALQLVGLGDRIGHTPRQLSGGQEQRVAIARALVTDPDLILADEPTGNLDATSASEVLALLTRLNKEFGKTIVMVTHDPHAARSASRIWYLDKGEVATSPSPRASQRS
jgi:putative ABC transport system ATP-binding protein